MQHRIRAEVTQPVQAPDGTVLIPPGTLLDPEDERILGLPPQHHRMVVESKEDDDDWPKPEVDVQAEEAKKAEADKKADAAHKPDEAKKADDMPPRPAAARVNKP